MTEEPSRIPVEPYTGSLALQIINDVKSVGELQIRLAHANLGRELKRRTVPLFMMALGGYSLALCAILASMCLVHLLHWVTSLPGNATERLPLWSCFAIAATVMAIIGIAMVLFGMSQFRKCSKSQN
jgi:hypothetical protein